MPQNTNTLAQSSGIRWTTIVIFVLIAAVAFGVRLAYLAQLSGNPLFEAPLHDAAAHHEWAQKFAEGEEWSVDPATEETGPYFRAPLYTWFLGTVYSIFGVNPGWTPRLIQSLLGALSCGMIFLLGARLFGRGLGIAAGLAAAVYWTLIYFDNELLIVPLIVFLDILAVYLLVRAHDRGNWHAWSAAGLVLGLSAIARPNVLLFAAGVCVWILFLERRRGLRRDAGELRRGIARCLAFGLALLLPILPVTLVNAFRGDIVLISSQAGVNFYIGNHPESDGLTAFVPGASLNWKHSYTMAHDTAKRALGHDPKPSEVSRYFFGKGFDFWKNDPSAAAGLFAKKVGYFFCRQEFGNNKCIYSFTEEFTPIVKWLPMSYGLIAPLGLLGIGICFVSRRREQHRLFPLWGFVAIYCLSVAAFFVNARFRMPVVPFLIIFAAFAAGWLIKELRSRNRRPLLAAATALLILFCIVAYVPTVGFTGNVKDTVSLFNTIAMQFRAQGNDPEALRHFEKAEEAAIAFLDSRDKSEGARRYVTWVYTSTLFFRGEILMSKDQTIEAVECWKKGLELLPPHAFQRIDFHDRLATALDLLGDDDDAAHHRKKFQEFCRRYNINPREK